MTSSSNEPKKMSIEEGLKIAGANFEKGSYHASSTIYTAILKTKPEILIANLRMAEINESFGNYDEAELFTKISSTILWILVFYLVIFASKLKWQDPGSTKYL